MPSTVAEGILGRPLSWAVVVGNGAIAFMLVVLLPVAVAEGASARQILLFASIILAWSSLAWYVAVILVVRPRRSVEGLRTDNDGAVSIVSVRGRARSSLVAAITAGSLTFASVASAVAVDARWRWVLVAVACAGVVAAVDQAVGVAQRRYLVLSPDFLEAGSFAGSARVDWDDVASISVQQGYGGHLVYRIDPRPGATSWCRISRHPMHKARAFVDVEPAALHLDPALVGANLLVLWEDLSLRRSVGPSSTLARLVGPEWTLEGTLPPRAELLMQHYRPEGLAR